ncbi:hypothetical protein glysoja_028873 [Glycine soja]|uniref:Uncharacterized protein n=1 Tax=Glycine soja TaxID=3848 RepID=A0A0B2RJE3_GLYSO|nr:hypothetical protein glysoja_028873 [Glycine soja]
MGGRKWSILVAIFILLLAMEAVIAQGQGNGNGNGKGKDKEEKEREKREKREKEKKEKKQRDGTNYDKLSPLPTGQERGNPKKNKKQKACFIDCSSSTCEATCKIRKANSDGYGSLCYDPRFVGGDGVMFYFHGAKGGNFAIVSDDDFQINAHFIGTRPQGGTRDYTHGCKHLLSCLTHTLVSLQPIECLTGMIRANGDEREVVVERTDETNSVRVTVSGLVELDIGVKPIGEQENKVHNYQLPSDDAFSHLETQFRFKKSTDNFEGVLGQTYRPGYVSPVKRGVPMPMMGRENQYQTFSLFSTSCNLCRFQRPSGIASTEGLVAQY